MLPAARVFLANCAALDLSPQCIRQGLNCRHECGPQLPKFANNHLKIPESSVPNLDLNAMSTHGG
jgi:hypothetical protein